MRIRDAGYRDYGIEPEEAREIKKHCASAEFNEHQLLFTSALSENKELAADLYYSIVKGLSYEDLDRICYMPIPKTDFYAHQRKTMGRFVGLLKVNELWGI